MPANIKKGVGTESKKKLLALAAEVDKQSGSREFVLHQKFHAGMTRMFARENAALEAALERDRRFKSVQRGADLLWIQYQENIRAARGNPRQIESAIHTYFYSFRYLLRANEAMHAAAYRRAVDDNRHTLKFLSLAGKADGLVYKKNKHGSGALKPFDSKNDDNTMDPAGNPPITPPSFTFGKPFDDGGQHTAKSLITFVVDANFSAVKGTANINCDGGWAGGSSARAVVGSYLTLPAGYSTLNVTAKVEVTYLARAIGMVGVSYAGSDAIVELLGTDNSVLTEAQLITWALAPVGWTQENEGEDTYFVNATFEIPSSGGEYMIRAGLRGNAWAAGNGYAYSSGNSEVLEIGVEAE